MDYKNIQELIKTMSDSKLSSLEIETDGICIKMRKGEQNPGTVVYKEENKNDKPQQIQNKIEEEISLESSVAEKVEEVKKNEEIDNAITINSPIVGTFYGAASPDAEPYVKKGSKVKKGEVLCILEAMKLMNEIEAEEDYEVLDVLVKNEEMVEYGQPLFKVVKL